ncbi:DUF120 domain-containing protein [Nostoc sp. BAE]|nr:DUF120 domain-containing protein [Nostoc commune BAE]
MKILKGKVVSGLGNFSYWIEKVQEYYLRKTVIKFFPGTLNIQLDQPYLVFLSRWSNEDFVDINARWLGNGVNDRSSNVFALQRCNCLASFFNPLFGNGIGNLVVNFRIHQTWFDYGDADVVFVDFLA